VEPEGKAPRTSSLVRRVDMSEARRTSTFEDVLRLGFDLERLFAFARNCGRFESFQRQPGLFALGFACDEPGGEQGVFEATFEAFRFL
jgi:hypothetical protein